MPGTKIPIEDVDESMALKRQEEYSKESSTLSQA